ncbi:MAG: RNA polymerase sigma factor [Egibacteraceae bacterium]
MEQIVELVRAAAGGDQPSWDVLVGRYSGLLWAVARGHRLSNADAADVVQTTWLRCVEHLGGLRDPERLGAWLATTARRECLRVLRQSGRAIPTDDDHTLDPLDPAEPTPEDRVVRADRDRLLWAAVDALGDRCRLLLRVLMADPPPAYDEVGAALQMPIGSIGPTRARCLDRLRRSAGLQAVTASPGQRSAGSGYAGRELS